MKGEERKEPHEPFTNLVTKGVLFMGWSLFMLSLIEMKRNTSEKRTRDSFSFNKNETEQTHDVGAASRGCVVCFSFFHFIRLVLHFISITAEWNRKKRTTLHTLDCPCYEIGAFVPFSSFNYTQR